MLQNIPKEKILEVVREGPTIPTKIVKRVGGDTMLIGAILSTLINTGEVKISTLKIGGSPVYYVPGQEQKLEEFTQYLNEKDRRTYQLIKEKNILQDSVQDPLIKVSIRVIKDFAKSFEIEFQGKKEVFWRFYLYDKDTAVQDAKNILIERAKDKEKEQESAQAQTKPPEQKPVNVIIKEDEAKKTSEKCTSKEDVSKEEATTQDDTLEEVDKKDSKHSEHKGTKENKDLKEKKDFFEQIKIHVHTKTLDMISKEKIKKTEYTLVLKNHDTNEYIYCVAKDKKSINEGDLSTALIFAQSKKMQCLFLTTGKLTKKAEQMRLKEFKDMIIEEII